MQNRRPPQGAQATLRAIRLLKLFTADRPQLRLAEVAEKSGLNKTTAHRLLAAMECESLIDRNPVSGHYRLGPALMEMGILALASNDLRQRARPWLKRLAHESGETATLEVPIDDSMLIVEEVTGRHVVGAGGNVGSRWPMHATSTGKALIAFDEDGTNRLATLQPITVNTITGRDEFQEQLNQIRKQGFAETVDELEDGFSGVAAAVSGHSGEVLGAISICGPTQRFTPERRRAFATSLRQAAAGIQPA